MSERIEFDLSDYEREHGRKPRNYGAWAFCTVKPGTSNYLDHCIWVRGTYQEAKRKVTEIAQQRGITLLYVCG
jgi:hypothetical protein